MSFDPYIYIYISGMYFEIKRSSKLEQSPTRQIHCEMWTRVNFQRTVIRYRAISIIMSGGLINFNVLGEKALSFRWNDLLKRIDDIVLRLLIDDDKV